MAARRRGIVGRINRRNFWCCATTRRTPLHRQRRRTRGIFPYDISRATTTNRVASLSNAIRRRRTAKSYVRASEGTYDLSRIDFLDMVKCLRGRRCGGLMPRVPWKNHWIHPLVFVHSVRDVVPGLYLVDRTRDDEDRTRLYDCLRRAAHANDDRTTIEDEGLIRVAVNFDTRRIARLLSREQDIAADGAFTVSFVAELDPLRSKDVPHLYRCVHWEAAWLGHALYLTSEAIGLRGSGIGSFYSSMARHFFFHDAAPFHTHHPPTCPYRPVYHFTVGNPNHDDRIRHGWPYDQIQHYSHNNYTDIERLHMAT